MGSSASSSRFLIAAGDCPQSHVDDVLCLPSLLEPAFDAAESSAQSEQDDCDDGVKRLVEQAVDGVQLGLDSSDTSIARVL